MTNDFEGEIQHLFVAEFGREPDEDELAEFTFNWWTDRYSEEHGRSPDAQELHDFILCYDFQENS
jgi:hypothetical protein